MISCTKYYTFAWYKIAEIHTFSPNKVANKFNDVIIPPFGLKEYLRKSLRNTKRAALILSS